MTPETLIAKLSGQSVALSEPVGGSVPEFTIIEFGWACARLRDPYLSAFRFRHGRDGSGYGRLRRYLRSEARRIAWNERWKQRIHGIDIAFYIEELVDWALAEETMSYPDRQRLLNVLIAAYPADVYEREFAPKQRRISMILDRWASAAHEHIARGLRNDEEAECNDFLTA